MWTITREYSFSAAHRLEGHPKCGRMHGHNYKVEVILTGLIDAHTGMVLDYGELDRVAKPVIDKLDHRYIVSTGNINALDPYLKVAEKQGDAVHVEVPASTAECIATWLHQQLTIALKAYAGASMSISVRETDKSFASYDRKVDYD